MRSCWVAIVAVDRKLRGANRRREAVRDPGSGIRDNLRVYLCVQVQLRQIRPNAKLEAGNWKLEAEIQPQPPAESWKLEAGSWKLEREPRGDLDPPCAVGLAVQPSHGGGVGQRTGDVIKGRGRVRSRPLVVVERVVGLEAQLQTLGPAHRDGLERRGID